jgi:hypothetical protein
MALNPSDNVQGGFPTLGDPPFNSSCRDIALAELEAAGAPRGSTIVTTREVQVWKEGTDAWKASRAGIHYPGMGGESDKEWIQVHEVTAELFGWKFSRAWYYWIACSARGEPINAQEAVRLDEAFGSVLRVDGFAGGQRPQGTVDSYHIDRPDALAALVESLKKTNDTRLEEWKRRAEGGRP